MKPSSYLASPKVLLITILLLTLGNIFFWSMQLTSKLPQQTLYSSGVTFSSDGIALRYINRVLFKKERITSSFKFYWNDKTSTSQKSGQIHPGWKGDWNVLYDKFTNSGPSAIDELDLEEDFTFNRIYLQSNQAQISILPLSGDFGATCFYFIHLAQVYCGASTLRSTNRIQP